MLHCLPRSEDNQPKPLSAPLQRKKRQPAKLEAAVYCSKEAAAYLGISVRTLHRRVKAGEIPAFVGPGDTSPYQFKKADLDAYLDRRRITYPKKKP